MRILISGFEAFGGRNLNPTALIIEALEHREIPCPQNLTVEQVLLPVTFEDAFEVLQKKINAFNPDVVISLGLAKREGIQLESVAVNHIDAEIEDNAGKRPVNQLISPSGPPTFLSTLPLQGLENTLKAANLPVKISNSAGTFVCNYLFYRLMETNQDTFRLCGFIHVPLLPEQALPEEPSLSFSDLKTAISLILKYIDY